MRKWVPEPLPGKQLRQNQVKSKRVYEVCPFFISRGYNFKVKFNPARYENTFRCYEFEGEYIPLALKWEKYKHPWEVREENHRKQIDEEVMSRMRIEALNNGETVDEELLQIKKKIREEPKVAEHYVDFIKCEVLLLNLPCCLCRALRIEYLREIETKGFKLMTEQV